MSTTANAMNAEPAPYETVSARKFLWMSLCTLTLYDVYWVYRTWQRIRSRTGEAISPFWRTCVAPFTCFGLFARIHRQAAEAGLETRWNPRAQALFFLVLSFVLPVVALLGFLSPPWLLLTFAAFVPLLPVAATTRELNARSGSREPANDRFTSGNVAGMVVGGALLLLQVVLTLLGY